MQHLFLGAGALVLSYLGVAFIRRLALRRNMLDIPNERSSHTVPTPRGGGIAIALIVLCGFALSRIWESDLSPGAFWGYWLGALIVATISAVDDFFTVSAKVRLATHFFAALLFVAMAGYVKQIYLPFFGELNWDWLGVPLTLVWIVGLTNAYNFMDGIDGIAAGQAIVAGGLWLVVTLGLGLPSLATLTVLVVGASFGFLAHNTPPARIFMGDIGSTVLGYTFAALPLLASGQTANSRLIVIGVLCVAPFVFDTALTMVRRAIKRENVLQPHRSHFYQRLVKLGYEHGPVSALYATLALLSSLLALIYFWGSDSIAGLGLLTVVLLLLMTAAGVTRLERQT